MGKLYTVLMYGAPILPLRPEAVGYHPDEVYCQVLSGQGVLKRS